MFLWAAGSFYVFSKMCIQNPFCCENVGHCLFAEIHHHQFGKGQIVKMSRGQTTGLLFAAVLCRYHLRLFAAICRFHCRYHQRYSPLLSVIIAAICRHCLALFAVIICRYHPVLLFAAIRCFSVLLLSNISSHGWSSKLCNAMMSCVCLKGPAATSPAPR